MSKIFDNVIPSDDNIDASGTHSSDKLPLSSLEKSADAIADAAKSIEDNIKMITEIAGANLEIFLMTTAP